MNKVEDIDLLVSNVDITLVSEYKYLSGVLDSTPSFSNHVLYLKNNAYGQIKKLGKLRA